MPNQLCSISNSLMLLIVLLVGCITPSCANAQEGVTIRELVAIKDIRKAVLSPDGKYIAYQIVQADAVTNSFKLSWHSSSVSLETSPVTLGESTEIERIPLDSGYYNGELEVSDIRWSPDSQWVYFTKRWKGRVNIWRTHRNGNSTQQITAQSGNITGLKIITKQNPKSNKEKQLLLFSVGRSRDDLLSIIKNEAEYGYLQEQSKFRPKYRVLEGVMIPPCTNTNGQNKIIGVLQKRKDRQCALIIWAYDVEQQTSRLATKSEIETYNSRDNIKSLIQSAAVKGKNIQLLKLLGSNGNPAYFEETGSKNDDGLFHDMKLVTGSGDNKIYCDAPECFGRFYLDFRELWWRNFNINEPEIIFKKYDGEGSTFTSFYGWVPGKSTVRTILRSDAKFDDCNLIRDTLICLQETWTHPRKIVSINLGSGTISVITDPNSEFQNIKFTKVKKVFAHDQYGHLMSGHLVYPKDYIKGESYPLIVTQYRSRGFLRGATGDEQPIHVFAQNGIAVLSVDHRELYIENLPFGDHVIGYIAKTRYSTIDAGPASGIEKMISELVDKGIVDQRRVGISGLSTGSSVLDTAVIRKNYAAASTAYSMDTSTPNLWPPRSAEGQFIEDVFGMPFATDEGYQMRKKVSLALNVRDIDTPYLLQIADTEADALRALSNYNGLSGAKKPVEMYIYPNENHVKWQPAHKYIVYQRNLDWFNFWLQGVEDDDPEKAEQYSRWHKMRDDHCEQLKGAPPSPRFNGEVGPWYCEQ